MASRLGISAASDIRASLDPAALGERLDLNLDPWQADLLRLRPKRALLNCSRQSGKTTTALLAALWCALYDAPALILIVSPSLRQSGEAFKKFMQLFHELDGVPELVAESALRCELANGSRVIALPGSERTVRGYAGVKLILLDEAARIEDALIQSLTPMLATVDGSLIALSTPFGNANWYARAWHDETQDWHRVEVSATQCPRLSAEFLESELRNLGAVAFGEEYLLEFHDDQMAMWNTKLIERAFTDEVTPLW